METDIPNVREELNTEIPPAASMSTGPRTAEGKRRSSQNARKHGLYSSDF